jgi:hypothetical protein
MSDSSDPNRAEGGKIQAAWGGDCGIPQGKTQHVGTAKDN